MSATNETGASSSDAKSAFSYATATTPEGYVCEGCGASKRKLWMTLFGKNVHCCDCAAKEENVDISDLGVHETRTGATGRLATLIGKYRPAVPVEDRPDVFWGNGDRLEVGLQWWRRLPLRDEPPHLDADDIVC